MHGTIELWANGLRHFLMTNALTNDDCRFDCILMNGTSGNDIEWLRDAFSLD